MNSLLTRQPSFLVLFTAPNPSGLVGKYLERVLRQFHETTSGICVCENGGTVTVYIEADTSSDCNCVGDTVWDHLKTVASNDATCPQEIRKLFPAPIVFDNTLLLAKKAKAMAAK